MLIVRSPKNFKTSKKKIFLKEYNNSLNIYVNNNKIYKNKDSLFNMKKYINFFSLGLLKKIKILNNSKLICNWKFLYFDFI